MIKDLGLAVITRQIVMDFYMKHDGDEHIKGCVSPKLLATVTKNITLKEPVPQTGWLMLDHPCSVREARCLQHEGVLPSVTLLLIPPPPAAAAAAPAHPRPPPPHPRPFHEQDIGGLRYVYRATLKEVVVNPEEPLEVVAEKCFSAIRAFMAGAQAGGGGQALHARGAPGVYRVLVLGPRGAGRRTQAHNLAKHFDLVHVSFQDLYREAILRKDKLAEQLRSLGPIPKLVGEVVNRRLLQKDCLDHGWVMTGYPNSGIDFEILGGMKTPPNRVMFLNASWDTCKERVTARGVNWCTGRVTAQGEGGPRVRRHPRDHEEQVEDELELYFTETLAELRAAAGITAVEVDASLTPDQVQVQLQAGVMAGLAFDIEQCGQICNMAADDVSLLYEGSRHKQ